MADVARRSGASLMTVSRVVNGEPGVREETAQRVRSAIDELGFRRNDGARILRQGNATASIGLVMEDLTGPLYSTIMAAVEQVARQRDYLLLAGSAQGDSARAAKLTSAFLARRVDGLIVAASLAGEVALEAELAPETKCVFVDRPSSSAKFDSVVSDNEGGVRLAVAHLVAAGHRRIGYLGDDEHFWTAGRRRDGFLAAVREHGLDATDLVGMGLHTPSSQAEIWQRWAGGPEPVTAVVTGNNRATLALIRHLRSAPELSVAYVGFDDFDLADLLRPAVTTVAQDAELMGARAAEMLFDRIGGRTGSPRQVVVPTHLIVRESGHLRR